MLVNLLVIPVSLEESPENSHPSDPDDLLWHTSVGSTLPLTSSGVPALATSDHVLADPSPGMDSHWLSDDETILDQLSDVLPC